MKVTSKRIITVEGIFRENTQDKIPLLSFSLTEENARELRDALSDALCGQDCRWKWSRNDKAWNPECSGTLYQERPGHCPICQKPTRAIMPYEEEYAV